ncbi:MAG: TrmH family RNA methyltransferase [bacterium]
MKEVCVILDNIRSTHNVGSIFRTSDAGGVKKIYLVGYTPAPLDRFDREVASLTKASLGAEKSVEWEQVADIGELIERLKKENFQIVAVEQDEKSVDYKTVELKDKVAIILGNEVDGVSKETLSLCDIIAEIPMKGEKESLNVSVSAGVALFRLLDV